MAWIRRRLRGNDVWVRTDETGKPAAGPDGRVDIAYKLSAGAKLYRAGLRNLQPTGDPDDERPRTAADGDPNERAEAKSPGGAKKSGGRKSAGRSNPSKKNGAQAYTEADLPTPGEDTIVVFTDGACTGNPGPMGIGAVIVDRGQRRELSEYLGPLGTNNIAELTAIGRALEEIPASERERDVWIHTDSGYSIGVLSKGWKAKANKELIADLRQLLGEFSSVRFVHVRGHAGIPDNERCDELGRQAIDRGY